MLGSTVPATPALPSNNNITSSSFPCLEDATNSKRKRRPAGTPDPDAEVVSLSPRTLLESDRYVCEICNQGFQRDQNLQMHRRRHKVPWKLLKRDAAEVRKRVFVCPEPSCLHHDPCHALGDLVGIKKHFRRKHSSHKQWVCARCSKAYAVQSDYKAHLKTCGTRGHSCDCGRVFSRVESFIEHQDACNGGRARADLQQTPPRACLTRTASSPSPSSDTNFSSGAPTWPSLRTPASASAFQPPPPSDHRRPHSVELQLLPASNSHPATTTTTATLSPASHEAHATKLQLSIGPSDSKRAPVNGERTSRTNGKAQEKQRLAMTEKALADEARLQAKRQVELAEQEFADAKRIRQQAMAELENACVIRDNTMKRINSMLLQMTCRACRQQFRANSVVPADENELPAVSFVSSVVTEGDGDENSNQRHPLKIFNAYSEVEHERWERGEGRGSSNNQPCARLLLFFC
ncbi:protein indeterminate-domain 16-like [Phoenix dactylifera]|uniref:Protein indeterminate-domain 16-like n=1 Tax=Phoenix dactylifera TaxID=42345 RepID=A0A8B7MTT5_PHODC|nr:protein indeterminate-domain 16-like [Phoenix dactylifera]